MFGRFHFLQMRCKMSFVHWEYLSGVLFLMGDGHTLILLILLIGSLIDSLHHWHHFMLFFLFLFCLAILSWLEFAHFFPPCTFYLLIWHVVLMQNDKTGACECVCWIYFLKCKWFCVCVYLCECKREQFTVVIGYPPALWVHMFELALHSWFLLIGIWGMWIQFVWARKHTGTGGWSFLWFYSVVSFPRCCQHLCVYVMIGSSMSTH